MNVSRETKKAEAIERLKAWGILHEAIQQFIDDDIIMLSEPPIGAYYFLDKEQQARVDEFEKVHEVLVYFVIREWTNMGELENYLYVSDFPEEWGRDRRDMKEGMQLAYVQNLDMPDCSEFGTIGIKRTRAAGLHRVW